MDLKQIRPWSSLVRVRQIDGWFETLMEGRPDTPEFRSRDQREDGKEANEQDVGALTTLGYLEYDESEQGLGTWTLTERGEAAADRLLQGEEPEQDEPFKEGMALVINDELWAGSCTLCKGGVQRVIGTLPGERTRSGGGITEGIGGPHIPEADAGYGEYLVEDGWMLIFPE